MVTRLEDPTTLTIRAGFEEREGWLARHPETLGVPPQMARHLKMPAVLHHGNDDAVREAITAAYEMQRR